MFIKESLKKLNTYVPGKPIEELARQLKLFSIHKLASNEVPFPPLYIKKAVLKEIENINRYPEANCFYLRKMLAKRLNLDEDQLIFGNGSDEIIVLVLRAFVSKGDQVLVGFPTFLIYEIQAKIQEAEVIRVPLRNYRYDLEGFLQALTKKTKVIFIANPDNPHGTYLTHKEVKKFLDKVPPHILVFFDEAYYEFVDRDDFPHTLELIKKRENVIVTRTFSKAYGLAGLRIGYGITTPEIVRILNKVREPFNVNRFAQVCACSALRNQRFIKKVKNYIKKEKDYLYRELRRLNIEFIESVTNFILVNFKEDTQRLYTYLLKKGIIIRTLDCWGMSNFFRVTAGLHQENRKFIKTLQDFINENHKAINLEKSNKF